jgi:hypothetical protein
MGVYAQWLAKESYYHQEVIGRLSASPFSLDTGTNQCGLRCDPGYWSNWRSTHNAASDALDQRCTWHNCKNWDYNANDPLRTAKTCTLCWDHADISAYATWDAKDSYKDKELVGRDTAEPFRLHTGQCGLQCDSDYWSNWQSTYNSASDAHDQRCTYNNCKSWGYANADLAKTAKTCTLCWTEPDVSDWSNWDVSHAYSRASVFGRDASEPFRLNTNKECELVCKAHYWSNLQATTGNPAADFNDQKCTSTNCKLTDYTVSKNTGEECTVCWDDDDIKVYNKWMGRSSYFEEETRNRLASQPFSLNSMTKKCELQCATNHWSNWKSQYKSAGNDQYDQRCTSDNCKTWDYAANSAVKNASTCTLCWDQPDMLSDYSVWDARGSYYLEEVRYSLTSMPFRLSDDQCGLQCATGYWSNWKSQHTPSQTVWNQRCTSDNCKAWDYSSDPSDVAKNSNACTQCWTTAD